MSNAHIKYCRGQSGAFTLVELLVVISIIALMIALILPVLREARETGLAIVCATGQRQMGISFAKYQTDYPSGYFPIYQTPSCYNPPGGWNSWNNYVSWWDALAFYMGGDAFKPTESERVANGELERWRTNMKALFCPKDPFGTVQQMGTWWFHPSSYGFPSNVTACYRSEGVWAGTPSLWKLTLVTKPSSQVMLTGTKDYYSKWETNEFTISNTDPYMSDSIDRKAWFHMGYSLNYLYFDGHVQLRKTPPHPMSYYANNTAYVVDGTPISTGGGLTEYIALFHGGNPPCW